MYYTTGDVAEMLGITDSIVKYNAKEGRINCSAMRGKLRLFSKEDIIAFAKEYNYELDEFAFYTREELVGMVRKMRE